ncbi:MAG: hypothetical protein ABGY95_07800 [Rubritalea sp.]|uniref:hypothetical protein n=1 Tax=Rubritalea sp. TaxID=2109375 RepID=UPI0032429173
MKALAILLSGLGSLSSFAADDILNFKNNDTLHGSFKGFYDTNHLRWMSSESSQEILFRTSEIRKIIFRKGLPAKPFTHSSLIKLTNGDSVPCAILSMDSEFMIILTSYTSEKKIAKKWIQSCQLHPLGQQLTYQGPFNKDAWKVTTLTEANNDSNEPANDPSTELAPWEFGNFSWYNRGVPGALVLTGVEHPESFRAQFKSESTRNSNVAFVFNADFNKPVIVPASKDIKSNATTYITSQFGSCFALRINAGSTSLGMYNVLEDGESSYTYLKPISGRSNYRNLKSSNISQLELRADFKKLVIAVYRENQLVNQWSLRDIEPVPRGRGIGFNSTNTGDRYVSRISDILIAPWNGVMDSALSLQDENSDIVLLANGRDRFSGTITSITDKQIHLKGNYADMTIPREEIHSITFATSPLAEAQKKSLNEVLFHVGTRGTLTATPIGTSANEVLVKHSILNELHLAFEYLTAITYDSSISILDQWNTKPK